MQPFIVTLAMMVAILGIARLLGGSNMAVHPVYTGTNATEDFDILRALVFQIVPVPGIFFIFAVLVFGFVLKVSTFGRYIYAIGGNEQAARLAGIRVDQLKIAVYAISGMLASTAGCCTPHNIGKASRMQARVRNWMPSRRSSSAAPT